MVWALQHTWKHPSRRITGFGRPEAGTSTLLAAPHRGKMLSNLLCLVTAPCKINVKKRCIGLHDLLACSFTIIIDTHTRLNLLPFQSTNTERDEW